jgi:arginase family enzyme
MSSNGGRIVVKSVLTAIGLDLDGSLAPQSLVTARLKSVLDCSEVGGNLRLRTNLATARAMADQLASLRERWPGPLLTFIGSGDLHHVALLLLETLAADVRPYTLVLIDNHPDWFEESPRYHCGNWVSSALRLAGVQEVVLAGQNSPDLAWYRFYPAPFQALCEGRLTIHPLTLQSRRVPLRWPRGQADPSRFRRFRWGTELRFQSVRATPNVFENLARRLRGRNIYLSIDKDCLTPDDAITDWDQGGLSLDQLVSAVNAIASNCRVIGADVCGDRAPSPLKSLFKRLDAGRLRRQPVDPAHAAKVNERANVALLDAFGIEQPERKTELSVPPETKT